MNGTSLFFDARKKNHPRTKDRILRKALPDVRGSDLSGYWVT
jgi:hypothetical protein